MGKITFSTPVPRTQLQTTAQGLIAQNFDRQCTAASSIMVGGTAYQMLVGVSPGDVIANAYVWCSVAGTGTSLFKAGFYSPDGVTRYAVSADQSALFSTAGTKAIPVAWSVPAGVTSVAVVIVATAATTLPTLRAGGASTTGVQIGSNAFPFSTGGTALSDLPSAGVTFVTNNTPLPYWVGLA